MKVLVCGGAGYIGSHIVKELNKLKQHEVVVLDNMTKGHKQAVPPHIPIEQGDIRDTAFLNTVFAKHKIDAVMVKS